MRRVFLAIGRGILQSAPTLLLATCLGCGVMETAVMHAIAPNPEVTRQKEETKRYENASVKINEADTSEKVEAQERTFARVSKESHPSLWASVVSGLYTEEGRRLAGVTVVALGSMIALGLRVASTWGLPGAFRSVILGAQDIKEQYSKGSPEREKINDILRRRQERSGVWASVNRKVKKVLGEV